MNTQVYVMDEHQKLAHPALNPKTESKPCFTRECKCGKIAHESHFLPSFNQRNPTYSPVKQPEGETNQQDAFLSCLKQEIYTTHQRLCYMTGESWRRLLNKTFLDSPCEILNTADTMGRRQGIKT